MSRYNNFEGQKCLDNDTFKWYTDHSTLNGVAQNARAIERSRILLEEIGTM